MDAVYMESYKGSQRWIRGARPATSQQVSQFLVSNQHEGAYYSVLLIFLKIIHRAYQLKSFIRFFELIEGSLDRVFEDRTLLSHISDASYVWCLQFSGKKWKFLFKILLLINNCDISLLVGVQTSKIGRQCNKCGIQYRSSIHRMRVYSLGTIILQILSYQQV